MIFVILKFYLRRKRLILLIPNPYLINMRRFKEYMQLGTIDEFSRKH